MLYIGTQGEMINFYKQIFSLFIKCGHRDLYHENLEETLTEVFQVKCQAYPKKPHFLKLVT